jgi:hypothetical protein
LGVLRRGELGQRAPLECAPKRVALGWAPLGRVLRNGDPSAGHPSGVLRSGDLGQRARHVTPYRPVTLASRDTFGVSHDTIVSWCTPVLSCDAACPESLVRTKGTST